MLSIPEIIKRLEEAYGRASEMANRPNSYEDISKRSYLAGRANGLLEAIKMLKGEVE